MNQLSFDEVTTTAQLSLGEIAAIRPGTDRADPTRRPLTDEQELAVERRSEPLLLAAGAGSGKTSVLVERFVRAVGEDGVAPGRILAITFTERAAGELRERVRARFGELGEREAARDTEAAFVSTFHGFCARLLRAHPLAAGLDPEFTVLDEGLAARLRGQAWAAALRGFLEGERSEAVDLAAAWGADRVRTMVTGVYAELRSKGERLPRLPASVFQPTLPAPVFQSMRLGSASLEETFGETPSEEVPLGEAPSKEMFEEEEEVFSGEISPVQTREQSAADGKEPGEVDAEGARACTLLGELLERFGREYELLKTRRGAVDFDDLELRACALLEDHETVRRAWAERFELMMVDEFQDTNPRQLAILRALERGNLFTVGDALQSIYGFRHADVSLFRARHDELAEHGASLSLTRNFRGRKPLLDVVNAVFRKRLGDGFTPLRAGRVEEAVPAEPVVELLLTNKRGWDEDEEHAARIGGELPPAPRWRQAEARLLAQRVAELVESGAAQAGDVVVLLRAVGDLEVYERALQDRGLSTLATVGGFWGSQQVSDLLAYLRTLANPLDELALYGTLASPLVGVSGDGLALLGREAKASKRGVWETIERVGEELSEDRQPAVRPAGADADAGVDALETLSCQSAAGPSPHADSTIRLPAVDRYRLVSFRSRLRAERAGAGRRTLSQLIERALDQSGYAGHVLTLSWPERRLANVHKLLRVARRYEASEGRDLRGFLDHVAHHQDALSGAEPDAPVAAGETEAVRLMSIHAAKGLEFGIVCVADLGRAQNLGVGDLLVDGNRVGLRLARLDGSAATPSLAWSELSEESRLAQAEEEDRILYVAMTRARERLLLSGAVDFERWPEQRLGSPTISWLGPALSPDLPASVQTLQPPIRELAVLASDGTSVQVGLRLNAPETAGTVLQLDGPSSADDCAPHLHPHPTQTNTTATEGEQAGDRHSASPIGTRGGLTGTGDGQRPKLLAPPGDAGRLETLSYTSLTELSRCSYRFYLERVLGMPEQRPHVGTGGESRGDGLEARVRGTIVHRLLESLDFLRSAAPSAEDVEQVARELGVRVASHEREELAALLRAALGTPLAGRLATIAPGARREHPFALMLAVPEAGLSRDPVPVESLALDPSAESQPDGVLLTGVLDLLAHEPDGGMLVVDYKSDRVLPGEDLREVVEREYSIQRLLYALAVLSDGAPRVEIVHWFLHRPSEPIGSVFAADERPRLQDAVARLVRNTRAGSFAVSEDPHRGLCLTCPGRAGLCSWSDSMTLREREGVGP
jgi:ATP-dependent helicase/nuclease subunit A